MIATAASRYEVFGWAADPDRPGGPLDVHVYVNGVGQSAVGTAQPRSDVQAAFPYAGPASGWSALVPAGARVCAYAIDVGGTTNTTLGCLTTPVADDPRSADNPVGALDEVLAAPGLLRLRGWAGDDGTAATAVRVYLDGRWVLDTVTGDARPDVARAFPGLGSSTGWSLDLPARPGASQTCVYALNAGRTGGASSLLGCRSVAVPGPGAPAAGDVRGSLDEATTVVAPRLAETVRRGWAFDGSAPTAAVTVRVRSLSTSLLGAELSVHDTTTGEGRPDVPAAFPGAGPNSGYRLTGSGGNVQVTYSVVCTYGVEVDQPGLERLLGCRP